MKSIIKIFTKKIFGKTKLKKNLKNYFGNFFIFKIKFGWNSVNCQKKIEKILKIVFSIFLFLKKKSVNSPIKGLKIVG